jgi:hypothetical protein
VLRLIYSCGVYIEKYGSGRGGVKKIENKLVIIEPKKLFINIGRQQGLELGDKFTIHSQVRFIYHSILLLLLIKKLEDIDLVALYTQRYTMWITK